MAKKPAVKSTIVKKWAPKPKKRNPGVQAKTKSSKNKGSDLYKKRSRGQG